jgi:hypothetical protein
MKAIERSIIAAIMIAFKKVPMPGFCPKNIQRDNTEMLIRKVIKPMEKSACKEMP